MNNENLINCNAPQAYKLDSDMNKDINKNDDDIDNTNSSTVRPTPTLTQSLVTILPSHQRRSLIDNTLAQVCLLKRTGQLTSQHTAAGVGGSVGGSISSLSLPNHINLKQRSSLPKSKSDSDVHNNKSNAKFSYKNHRTVKIASTGITLSGTSSTSTGLVRYSNIGGVAQQQQTAAQLAHNANLNTPLPSTTAAATAATFDLRTKLSSGVTIHSAIPKSSTNTNPSCPYTYIKSVIISQYPNEPVTISDTGESSTQSITRIMKPIHESEFIIPTSIQIQNYSNDVVSAVRSSNLSELQSIYNQYGKVALDTCNKFGESILHIACRRSTVSIVSYLINIVQINPRIKDDYGRNPLHDACWRSVPEYGIVELLLEKEYRLMYSKDVRGHLPFQYARKEHWADWITWFDTKKKELILR